MTAHTARHTPQEQEAAMKKGTRIVYTATLGGMDHEGATHYSGTVTEGTEGVYLGRDRSPARKD